MSEKESGVSLHIERLVLNGVPLAAGSVVQLQLAVQNELTRLLGQDGRVCAEGALHSLTAPGFLMTGDSAPADLGRQIAQSVYQSLNERGQY
jgi:hypothetical protein